MTDLDTAQAAMFLAALSSDSSYTFQTIDSRKPARRGMTLVLHGPFATLESRLADLNRRGSGVFVMVNRGDLCGRTAENVIGTRALFVDLDGAPLEPVLAAAIAPRIVVETSPGKWHCYWPVVDMPLDRFSGAQKALALQFVGDRLVHDKPRVMRLPGFLHLKGEPFLTKLITCDDRPLTWDQMSRAFDLTSAYTLPNVIKEGERNTAVFNLARAASRKGVPESEQLAKALKVNDRYCQPPLPSEEVRTAVCNAYRLPVTGIAGIPLTVIDSDAYKGLSHGARSILTVAYRKLDSFNNGSISLAHSELREWFPQKKTFQRYRAEATESGLLVVSVPAVKPGNGRAPKAALYSLAIGAKTAPYKQRTIGAKTAPPEALQAVAVARLKGSQLVEANFQLLENPAEPTRFPHEDSDSHE